MISISVQGNKAAIRGIEKAKREFTEYMEDNVQMLSDDIYAKANSRVPSNTGFLKNSLYREVRGLNAEVGASANYAAFMEFGTGTLTDVPNGLEEYAARFKGMKFGSLDEFKEDLKDWMRKKGIEESALFPIMMKILTVGVEPQPFLFNSAFEETRLLIDRLKRDGVI